MLTDSHALCSDDTQMTFSHLLCVDSTEDIVLLRFCM